MKPPGVLWSPGEAAAVNQFLSTPVGIKWLRELWSRKPKIDQGSIEKAALSGAFAAGYERAWEEISNTRVAVAEPDNASVKGIDPTKD
jgi:hypothetical protein